MKKLLTLLLTVVLCFSVCACGGAEGANDAVPEEYVEMIDENGETIRLGMTDIATVHDENALQFDEKYLNKDVTIVGKLTNINGAVVYNGHEMDSYVELEGWLVDTTGHEDVVSELAVGDMVKITGNIWMAFGSQAYIYKVNDEVVTIEKITQE